MHVDRRSLLLLSGLAVTAVGIPGLGADAIHPPPVLGDTDMLNIALGLEHEAIYAYGLAGKSGLLSEKAAEVGLLFQGSHEGHRDLLAKIIRGKGGRPVSPAEKYTWGQPLKDEKDVLLLAF